MRYLATFLAIYFLAGIVSARFNYWLVRQRTSIIEKFHKLRLAAFQNNLGVQIEFNQDIFEIGFDADKARDIISNDEFKKYMSDDGLEKMVAVAICLLGFFNVRWLWRDWQSFNKLRESYQQAEDVVDELIS